VPTQVTFQVYRRGVPAEIRPGDSFLGRDTLRISVAVPADLAAERLELMLDGTALSPVDRHAGDPRHWTLTAQLPSELSEADHLLLLLIQRSDGQWAERSVSIRGLTVSGELRILQAYNFPNPFGEIEERAGCPAPAATTVFYTVNRNAESARLSIYTQSGRRIRQMPQDGPPLVNTENAICWDGKDAEGDAVANGVYFYKLELRSLDGKTVEKIERMARVR
jgi:hypothetical protein